MKDNKMHKSFNKVDQQYIINKDDKIKYITD